MSDGIVPFGKHKGKSVDALLDDRPYLEWLLSQPWAKEKLGNVYNVVINHGTEPVDTPEHNAMQVQFLNPDFCRRVGALVVPESLRYTEVICRHFERHGVDVEFKLENPLNRWEIGFCIEVKPSVGDDYPAVLRQIRRYRSTKGYYYQGDRGHLVYEDYKFVLLVGEYTGIGANVAQFREFFKTQGVTVVFADEVEAVRLES